RRGAAGREAAAPGQGRGGGGVPRLSGGGEGGAPRAPPLPWGRGRRQVPRSRPASRAGGNPQDGRGGPLQCACRSVGEEQAGTFLLIYRQIASCFNRFPGSRNPLYGCADNIGRNVMTVVRMLWVGMAALLAATFGAPAPAVAQDYPNQRVTIVVPFGAGSVTDIMARILADELAKRWNQQVVVENR